MDARVKQLVNMIEDAQPVAVAVLAKRLEVSERAVRNYIHRANDNLAGVARIVGSKGQYRIDVARADELARLLDGAALAHPGIPDTRDGRVSFLLNDLLMRSQWVTIEEYADLLYVSARTLSNDMRLVEQKLAQFDLTLEKRPRYGIRVAGGESQRRLCLASLVRPVLPDTDDAELAERLRASAAGRPRIATTLDPQAQQTVELLLADRLGISDLLKKYPYEVSGGQKQRAAVARALITSPQILLADEPTGALDSRASDSLLSLFGEINRAGQTILMVTHSTKAASHAGRVLFIKDGVVFHQIYRGGSTNEEMFHRISDTLTAMAAGA
mgnify:CR=1 FL=1